MNDMHHLFDPLSNTLVSITQFLDNMPGQLVFDFTVSGHWLALSRMRILIPIVSTTVSQHHASDSVQLFDEFRSLHGMISSATWWTHGMAPLSSSFRMSRRFS
jgi:hypothetical protein